MIINICIKSHSYNSFVLFGNRSWYLCWKKYWLLLAMLLIKDELCFQRWVFFPYKTLIPQYMVTCYLLFRMHHSWLNHTFKKTIQTRKEIYNFIVNWSTLMLVKILLEAPFNSIIICNCRETQRFIYQDSLLRRDYVYNERRLIKYRMSFNLQVM